jgi:hypothetical protein
MLKGLPMGNADEDMPWVSELGGRWPDDVFLTLGMVSADGASYRHAEVFRWTHDGWIVARKRVEPTVGLPEGKDEFHYADFTTWTQGRVLGLAVYETPGAGADTKVSDFEAARPRLDVVAGDTSVRPPDLDPDLCPDRLLALPTGEIFVVGQRCTTGAAWVQRFTAGDARGVEEKLAPPSSCDGPTWVRALDARRADDVWIAAENLCRTAGDAGDVDWPEHGYFARFDGHAWTTVKPPAPSITSMSVAPDGTVWATSDAGNSGLWRRAPGYDWEEVALPALDATRPTEKLEARQVWAKTAADVWVVAGRYDTHAPVDKQYFGSVVLRAKTAPPVDVVRFPTDLDIRAASADVSVPLPANAACARPFLPLERLPESAPAQFDYADLRAAAVGHPSFDQVELREVVWKRERWIGATGDYEALERLRAVLLDKVGAMVHPYCRFYPRLLRKFTIDGTNGELTDR